VENTPLMAINVRFYCHSISCMLAWTWPVAVAESSMCGHSYAVGLTLIPNRGPSF